MGQMNGAKPSGGLNWRGRKDVSLRRSRFGRSLFRRVSRTSDDLFLGDIARLSQMRIGHRTHFGVQGRTASLGRVPDDLTTPVREDSSPRQGHESPFGGPGREDGPERLHGRGVTPNESLSTRYMT